MSVRNLITVDANEATASVAYRLSEVIAIYPITPASPMGELPDEWAAKGQVNIWGEVPQISEMQSEGGAAGAVHGALQAGALSTTFTASQGLLLMIPNMYKIAGELTACVLHVAARTLATHALSIFGDHSDVMACRQTGFAMLASNSVQQAHDMATIAHAATLKARVPFLHFFDGFRTSHELNKIEKLNDDDLREMIDEMLIAEHRSRALSPDSPKIRGTAQNPDTFFQARESCNPFYDACPGIVEEMMAKFEKITGRKYELFEYEGHAQAERVIVVMGSGAETVRETVRVLAAKGEKIGALEIRLFRPFAIDKFVEKLPKTVKKIAVLDRTKEPGGVGEPLFLDVVAALNDTWEGAMPKVVGGRYGLSSKEFTPTMVASVFAELNKDAPKRRFTVGIVDDVTKLSIDMGEPLDLLGGVYQALFFGLGSDGTVGANKNTIKIVGTDTANHAQGYFVYDSKKSGAMTVSHVRFSPGPIRAPYLIEAADFVACHQFEFTEKIDLLERVKTGGTFLLNTDYGPDEVWDKLPREMQQDIIGKKLKFFVIDAYDVAGKAGMGRRINTVMQVCFFALAKVLPVDEAITSIKGTIEKTYGKKGAELVRRNIAAVDASLEFMKEIKVPGAATSPFTRPPMVADTAPEFIRRVSAMMMANKGDLLPVSAFPPDGTWPTGSTMWEKRNIALEVPVWNDDVCIQCNKCAMVCPHAAVRAKVYDPKGLDGAPETFKHLTFKSPSFKGQAYTIQVAVEDCTGCGVCVEVCPGKDKSNPKRKALGMALQRPLRETERKNYEFFLELPEVDRTQVKPDVKHVQLLQPLFEYSGACPGCGETPYIKLMTQLFGDRALIANATGCSSIYGGNLPTTPYTTNKDGRGPAWANSLFEDNAEFGMGMRLAVDAHKVHAQNLVKKLASSLGDEMAKGLLDADQTTEAGIIEQRVRVAALREKLGGMNGAVDVQHLKALADYLVKKSVWLFGGDGWAYDIGYGGLDHVLASDKNVNVLVMDTEVYSNTGGQASKATPLGASAKFATAGKAVGKKDLGLLAMSYGHVYVAQVAFGAKDAQTLRAFTEADSYEGPSIIIAYSHCIAHGYDLIRGLDQQKALVDAGGWPLYRFDPRRAEKGEAPLALDSGEPKAKLKAFMQAETRFRMVEKMDPKRFERLAEAAEEGARRRTEVYRHMSQLVVSAKTEKAEG